MDKIALDLNDMLLCTEITKKKKEGRRIVDELKLKEMEIDILMRKLWDGLEEKHDINLDGWKIDGAFAVKDEGETTEKMELFKENIKRALGIVDDE